MSKQGKTKPSSRKLPRGLVPKWPDALPAFSGTQFVFSLNCGNSRLSWARINDTLGCEIFWSTKPPEKNPLLGFNLFDQLPQGIQREIYPLLPQQQHLQQSINNKALCSHLVECRKSVITVYLMSSHAEHERRAIRLFDGLPAVIYKLSSRDFLEHGSIRGLSVYPTMGVDRIAALMGAMQRFPDRISHLVIDGGTALTYTTVTKNKQIGGGISLGPRMKLCALSQFTGALPTLNEKELDAIMEQLQSSNAKLETICTSNTEQNMMGPVLKETTIYLTYVVQEWRKTLPDDIPREQTPVVVLCGGDGTLFSMLLRPNHSNLFETSPDIQQFLSSGEILGNIEQCTVPENAKAFQMVLHGSAIHSGVQNILISQRKALATTDVSAIRDELVGQRIVINGQRGTVVSVNRSGSTHEISDDTYVVFIDADNHFVETNSRQLVVLGTKATQSIGVLNKMKDAKGIIAKLDEMVLKNPVALRTDAAAFSKLQTEQRRTKTASLPAQKAQPANRFPQQVQAQFLQQESEPGLKKSASDVDSKGQRKDAINQNRFGRINDELVLAKQTAAELSSKEKTITTKNQAILDLVDALMKLYKKKRLQLKSLGSMNETWIRAHLYERIKHEAKGNPDVATTMDTEAKRFAFLARAENMFLQSAERKQNEPTATQQQASLETQTKSPSIQETHENKQVPPSSTKNKQKKRDLLIAKKESYVGQRVAKYFTDSSGKNELYPGRVLAYFPSDEVEQGMELWQIRFDDGDEEDVDETELYVILDLYKRNRLLFLKK